MDEIERLKNNDELVHKALEAFKACVGNTPQLGLPSHFYMTMRELQGNYQPTEIKYGLTVIYRPVNSGKGQTVTLDYASKAEVFDAYEVFTRNVRRRHGTLTVHGIYGPVDVDVFMREQYTPQPSRGPMYFGLKAGW
jgi:hypothetical protein